MKRFLGILLSLLFCLSSVSGAQTQPINPSPSPEDPSKPSNEPPIPDSTTGAIVEPPKDLSTGHLRSFSKYTLNAHLSMLSTWLPGKFGGSIGVISSDRWTWEAEITRRSITAKLLSVDLGQIVDQRYGLQARWYPGGANSFNFILGIFKSQFSFELGPSYLANIPGTPNTTVWKFESIGPQLGLSNRYQWSNGITFGVDWFVLYIPSFNKTSDESIFDSITNAQDRDDLDKATKAIKNIPQFDLLKLTLGYTF